MKSILKWYGGKQHILPAILERFPKEPVKRYVEPFVGGGSVLLGALEKDMFEQYFASDINPALINWYRQMAIDYTKVVDQYISMVTCYHGFMYTEPLPRLDLQERWYYSTRDEFNRLLRENKYNQQTATLFMFLNRLSFNGLYRINKNGVFNVSFGKYRNIPIPELENVSKVSSLLRRVAFRICDYKRVDEILDEDTFVYLDPPYEVLRSRKMIKQDCYGFSLKDHEKLSKWIHTLTDRGVKVLLSTPAVIDFNNEGLVREWYKGYDIVPVYSKTRTNSKSASRTNSEMLLISNYEV